MPRTTGILETSLYVEDVERSTRFYQQLFDCEVILEEDRLHALSIAGRDVLLLFKRGGSTQPSAYPGGIIPPHDGRGTQHIAFAIPLADLQAWRDHLNQLDIPLESEVRPERGGHSLYFRDPDNHCIELATPGIWTIY